jgi:hypothetical protein
MVRPHLYEVPSETETDKMYMCDSRGITCTCPDFRKRRFQREKTDPERRCKHLRQLFYHQAALTPLARAAEMAALLTDEQLRSLADKHNGTAAGAACWLELACRARTAIEKGAAA